MSRRWQYRILLIGLAITLSPLISVLVSSAIAQANGCTLHEGFVNPCVVMGRDIGDSLYAGFVMGWLMLLTLPVTAILLLVLAIRLGIDVFRYLRRR